MLRPATMFSDSGDSEATLTSPPSDFHPLFSAFSDADIILGSRERVLFRVNIATLKRTSAWFRAMFSLPPAGKAATATTTTTTPPGSAETLFLDEDTQTLEGLLRMACGLPVPALDGYDEIEALLHAAEKYDMPGPASIVRIALMRPAFLAEPVRLYAIACRYGWPDEARLASTHTLTLNIHAPEHKHTLMKLGAPALLGLIDLHRSRREALRHRLDQPPFVNDTGDTACSHCGSMADYHTWSILKFAIIMEMDVRPAGDTICSQGLLEWPAARACWDARCLTCNRVLYDKAETLRVVRECIDALPDTVDDLDIALPIA
ncbi:hypothetical protein DAEQUDRAFT_767411 [Daedalea quercina L-15889]|uniref:BTB domain-containing protein n=1 Tax=Daedalea quercina L-15889 TaxID=1314783 RepID=A0A165NNK4_9APHY|nr:hypothetical protein DAEQUDRAFT_767411 [Daedalea quercina L-15889]